MFNSLVSFVVFFQFLLLGAVPFPKDVPRLKQLGVGGVITLNEPYETLVPTSLYLVYSLYSLLFVSFFTFIWILGTNKITIVISFYD